MSRFLIPSWWETLLKPPEANWKLLRTEVEIPVVFLNIFSISSLLAKPPIALSLSNGVQTISLSPKKSLWISQSPKSFVHSRLLSSTKPCTCWTSLSIYPKTTKRKILYATLENLPMKVEKTSWRPIQNPVVNPSTYHTLSTLANSMKKLSGVYPVASQVLGLDTDAYVIESLLTLLLVLSTCLTEPEFPRKSYQS